MIHPSIHPLILQLIYVQILAEEFVWWIRPSYKDGKVELDTKTPYHSIGLQDGMLKCNCVHNCREWGEKNALVIYKLEIIEAKDILECNYFNFSHNTQVP